MSEYENVFKRKELHDMYTCGEVKPLGDLYLIEDVALTIKELNKKLDFYKEYKKKKSHDINNEIKVIENQVEFYKSVIISTLIENKEKNVKFPGSCSASSRDQKPRWRIDDEEEFIKVLQEAEKSGENVDDVLEKVIQYNIRKRQASKLLNIWEQNGKLEKFLNKARKGKDVVIKEPAKTTVSLTFIEEEEDNINDEADNIKIPVKSNSSNDSEEDYDSL